MQLIPGIVGNELNGICNNVTVASYPQAAIVVGHFPLYFAEVNGAQIKQIPCQEVQ